MADDATLDTFHGIFRGNPSFYVKHQAPFTENSKGKLTARWVNFGLDKKTKEPLPVTKELYRGHLNGGDGLAIAPLTDVKDKRNVCFYAAIDIDVYDVNYKWLVHRLYALGFKFAAFLSKSGGLHIYFFFGEPEPGDKAIEVLNKIVEVFGLNRLYTSDKSKNKVEIFPKQATYASEDSKGSCLFLPFYNSAKKDGCRTKMLSADGVLLGIKKALVIIESMFTSVREIEQTLSELPYSDAPFCIQMVLLTGALTENSGRNDFLFTAALYLKLRDGKDFKHKLEEMNSCLEAPLEQKDIDRIYKSVTEQDWQIWGRCKKPPMSEYCDRTLCKKRKFGIGRDKDNYVSNVEFGKLVRVLAGDPYYLWDARLAGNEKYIPVRIDGEADLLNQKVVQRACIRYLNQTPITIKMAAWETKVNECLAILEEIKVARGTDTSNTAVLRNCFLRFLTHQQKENGQPHVVELGRVYREEGIEGSDGNAYYFNVEGLKKYLTAENIQLHGINLREQLLMYGCTEGEVKYTTPSGLIKTIQCWKRIEDDELRELGALFEDIYEGSQDIIQKDTWRKEKAEEGDDGSDTNF
jgi:hypothetical protein